MAEASWDFAAVVAATPVESRADDLDVLDRLIDLAACYRAALLAPEDARERR